MTRYCCSWYSVLHVPSYNNKIVIESLTPNSSYQVYLRDRNYPFDVKSETVYFYTTGKLLKRHLQLRQELFLAYHNAKTLLFSSLCQNKLLYYDCFSLVFPELKSTRLTDVIILVFLLLLWCLAVSLFFKRWGQTFLRYHDRRLR